MSTLADAVVAAMDLQVAAERDLLQVAHCSDVPDEDLKTYLVDSLQVILDALHERYQAEKGTYEDLQIAAVLRGATAERLLQNNLH